MRFKLDLSPGIFSDDTAFSTGGRWVSGSNVRFQQGKPEVIGSWREISIGGTGPSRITGLSTVLRQDGKVYIFAGGNKELFVTNSFLTGIQYNSGFSSNTNWVDISPTGIAGSPIEHWTFDYYGDELIAHVIGNNGNGKIYSQTGTSAVAAITNAPENVVDIVVADERQLIALGCNEEVSGTFNPRAIRGSDIEDITDWTTSASNSVFEVILESDGSIVSGRKVGSYLAVWTTDELFLGTFIGEGDQVWRFDRIADNCGLASKDSLVISHSSAYWLGVDGQFRAWTVGEQPQIIPCTVHNQLNDSLGMQPGRSNGSPVFKIRGVEIFSHREIWWFYPDTRDSSSPYGTGTGLLPSYPTRYLAYSILEGTWFTGELERSAAHAAGAFAKPIMANESKVYYHELDHYGDFDSDHVVAWNLKADGIHYSTEADAYKYVVLKGFWPDFYYKPDSGYYSGVDTTDSADITVTVSAREYPQSAAVLGKTFTVSPTSEKEDFLTSPGRILTVAFSGLSVAAGTENAKRSWTRFGVPSFEIEPAGTQ